MSYVLNPTHAKEFVLMEYKETVRIQLFGPEKYSPGYVLSESALSVCVCVCVCVCACVRACVRACVCFSPSLSLSE